MYRWLCYFGWHKWNKWESHVLNGVQQRTCCKCNYLEERTVECTHNWTKWKELLVTSSDYRGNKMQGARLVRECTECGDRESKKYL